jgi:hypothetical protein
VLRYLLAAYWSERSWCYWVDLKFFLNKKHGGRMPRFEPTDEYAKAISLDVPSLRLGRADKVIE